MYLRSLLLTKLLAQNLELVPGHCCDRPLLLRAGLNAEDTFDCTLYVWPIKYLYHNVNTKHCNSSKECFARSSMLCITESDHHAIHLSWIYDTIILEKKNIGLLCPRILSHHKREMKLQLRNNMRFCSRSNLLIDSHCNPGISFIDGSVCIHSSKSFSTPANEKTYSFRPGLNSGLIDIMAWKWFIHLPHKLLLVTASALKPEPAAIYLLICIKLTLSEVIALISSVYYCTH